MVENIPHDGIGLSDPELHERVREALASRPPAERAAAVVAFGFDEGAEGVAVELDLSDADADAITRSALQLLRLGRCATSTSTTPRCTPGSPAAAAAPARPSPPPDPVDGRPAGRKILCWGRAGAPRP